MKFLATLFVCGSGPCHGHMCGQPMTTDAISRKALLPALPKKKIAAAIGIPTAVAMTTSMAAIALRLRELGFFRRFIARPFFAG